jgi:hypothetical protein
MSTATPAPTPAPASAPAESGLNGWYDEILFIGVLLSCIFSRPAARSLFFRLIKPIGAAIEWLESIWEHVYKAIFWYMAFTITLLLAASVSIFANFPTVGFWLLNVAGIMTLVIGIAIVALIDGINAYFEKKRVDEIRKGISEAFGIIAFFQFYVAAMLVVGPEAFLSGKAFGVGAVIVLLMWAYSIVTQKKDFRLFKGLLMFTILLAVFNTSMAVSPTFNGWVNRMSAADQAKRFTDYVAKQPTQLSIDNATPLVVPAGTQISVDNSVPAKRIGNDPRLYVTASVMTNTGHQSGTILLSDLSPVTPATAGKKWIDPNSHEGVREQRIAFLQQERVKSKRWVDAEKDLQKTLIQNSQQQELHYLLPGATLYTDPQSMGMNQEFVLDHVRPVSVYIHKVQEVNGKSFVAVEQTTTPANMVDSNRVLNQNAKPINGWVDSLFVDLNRTVTTAELRDQAARDQSWEVPPTGYVAVGPQTVGTNIIMPPGDKGSIKIYFHDRNRAEQYAKMLLLSYGPSDPLTQIGTIAPIRSDAKGTFLWVCPGENVALTNQGEVTVKSINNARFFVRVEKLDTR